jgi:murein DD-endopeptidase MepM/ murein hydrolase activator NlpD
VNQEGNLNKDKVHETPEPSARINWLSAGAWVIAFAAVGAAIFVGLEVKNSSPAAAVRPAAPTLEVEFAEDVPAALPAFPQSVENELISRRTDPYTIIPNRPRPEVQKYTVNQGDAVFGIAQVYNIEPESVLWANYDLLNDNPDYLAPGMELNIPPVDGVYYQFEEGDTLEAIAAEFEVALDDILNWSGNQLDLIDPVVAPGEWVMVPGGHREFRQWLVPTIPRSGGAGVSRSVLGPGACEGSYDGAYGSGAFIYPTYNHTLSGNDYWSGHLGIDLAAGAGDGVRAADSGVVVFSGWAYGGYGYMIMIDHGNGYQTLYGHLNQVNTVCGQSVGGGQVIGLAGSTGNSTGVHLHFEVRFQGGFISPWFVLPAP